MKYTIIASALAGNKGAASMLEASIQLLDNKKDAEFVLLSVYPKQDAALNTYKNLEVVNASPLYLGLVINPLSIAYRLLPFLRGPIGSLSPPVRHIAESAALLDQGGITFSDGREKYLIYNIASILPALVLGTPVVKCAQALGPFKGKVNRFFSKMFLPRVAVIVARGDKTEENLADLSLDNVVSGVDFAFAMSVLPAAKKSAEKRFPIVSFAQGKKNIIGVSPSQVVRAYVEKDGSNYTELMTNYINGILANGHKVVLLPHSVRHNPEKIHNNDLPLCMDIYEGLKDKKNVLFVDEEASAQELRHIISFCDVFVASRFHAMISALAMEVPPLVIGWSHKYKEVLKMFDLSDEFVPYEAVGDNAKLLASLEDAVARKAATKTQIAKSLSGVIARSKMHKEYIQNVSK